MLPHPLLRAAAAHRVLYRALHQLRTASLTSHHISYHSSPLHTRQNVISIAALSSLRRLSQSKASYTTITSPLRQPNYSHSHEFTPEQEQERNPDTPPPLDQTPPTDLHNLDIHRTTPPAPTTIDAMTQDSFSLADGRRVPRGKGVLFMGEGVFWWAPWASAPSSSPSNPTSSSPPRSATAAESSPLPAASGPTQLFLPHAFRALTLLHPRPELLVIGTGRRARGLGPETARFLAEEVGVSVEVMDTRSAVAAYNLLAAERGVGSVAGAMLPMGWG